MSDGSPADDLGPFDESNPFEESPDPVGPALLGDTEFELGQFLKEARKVADQGTKSGYTVLIVDDDENTRRILARYLTSAGLTPIEDNGRGALAKAIQFQASLVLLDLVLSAAGSGYDLMRQIKANPSTAHLPIVVCTARKDKESIVRAVGLGAAGYIVKPFTRETILDKVLEIRKKQAREPAPAAPPPPPARSDSRSIARPAATAAPPPARSDSRSIARPVATAAASRPRPTIDTGGLPLLIIDDEKMARHILKVILEQSGFVVEEATRGEEGLAKLDKVAYAALFLDVMMPGMNGFQVAQRIRATPAVAQLPIVLCTARSSKEDVLLAAKLGIRHFIKKPFTREVVLQKLGEALGK